MNEAGHAATTRSASTEALGGQAPRAEGLLVIFAGAAPGFVAGVTQIDVRIPVGIASGQVPVVVRIGEFASQGNVTVAVRWGLSTSLGPGYRAHLLPSWSGHLGDRLNWYGLAVILLSLWTTFVQAATPADSAVSLVSNRRTPAWRILPCCSELA